MEESVACRVERPLECRKDLRGGFEVLVPRVLQISVGRPLGL